MLVFHEMTGFYAGSEAQVRKSLYLVPAAADLISVLTGLTGDWGWILPSPMRRGQFRLAFRRMGEMTASRVIPGQGFLAFRGKPCRRWLPPG